jgi:cytochrome bd-type quinol oxidase subunit 2
MSLDVVWFVVVAFFWCGFFVLEGFDFGVGALHRLVGRTPGERTAVLSSVGPLWDANEVWLIVAGASVFAAFPAWYATWFSAGYLALMLLLVALIFRGVSFEWRERVSSPRWHGTWGWALTIGSVLIPLVLGIALGDLLAGLPVDSKEQFTGSFWDLFTPYGVFFGLTLLTLSLLHGATYLGLRTGGAIAARAHSTASRLSWPAMVMVAVLAVWTVRISDGGIWRAAAAAVPVVGALAAALLLRVRHERGSFAGTAVAIGGTVAALFANLYPYVMVSSTDTAHSLTVAGTASSDYTLKVMTVVALVFTPLVLLYQGWSYWVFRARVTADAERVGADA